MQITALLKTFIYLIASSLFLPVLLLLSGLFIWMLVYSGTFFRLWLERKKIKNRFRQTPCSLPDKLLSKDYKRILPVCVANIVGELEALEESVGDGSKDPVRVTNLLRDAEHRILSSLDGLKMVIRIGPGLGLIGTLIPMGTGLASLGQGDLGRLSQDLVVAFTTTVVGMALGLLAYFYFTVQRRWAMQDIKNMALAAELLTRDPRQETVHHEIP